MTRHGGRLFPGTETAVPHFFVHLPLPFESESMKNRRLLFLVKRVLEFGLAASLATALFVHCTGGFRETVMGVTVSATDVSNPVRLFCVLLLLRVLVPLEWKPALLVLGSLALTLLALEGAVRLVAVAAHGPRDGPAENRREASVSPMGRGEKQLGEIIQPSTWPDVIYELAPDMNVTFRRKTLTTNKRGFRNPTVTPAEDDENTIRIVGLGDSVMFGWGVEDGAPYLRRLEDHLRETYPGRAWHVVNAAVPGYNTSMEVATLKSRLLVENPELVIIDFVRNDFQLPNFLMRRISPFTLSRSFLADFVSDRLRKRTWDPFFRLVTVGTNPFDVRLDEGTDLVPDEYRHLAGIGAFRKAMAELGRISRDRGFPVLVFSSDTMPLVVREEARTQGFFVMDTGLMSWGKPARDTGRFGTAETKARHKMAERLRSAGIDSYYGSPLAVSGADPHPSALGHRVLEAALFAYLEESGLLHTLLGGEKRPYLPR